MGPVRRETPDTTWRFPVTLLGPGQWRVRHADGFLDPCVPSSYGYSGERHRRAARLAAVDQDIAAIPMEMFTMVGDSAALFPGGQIQRLKIAAALVRNPCMMFLDEATSWLDAVSQAEVMHGIEQMAVTRIVIAPRLSTIRMAQRIYVLQAGRIVQEAGSHDQWRETQGPFLELVQRQMA